MRSIHRVLMLHGHGQSADIFQPKTRYLQRIFHALSDEMNFEFEFLSGILPAYPDDDDKENYRVWGYGDPNQDRIRGFDYSIQHIISKMEECGPFSGIVGFSSGGTMAAIITSLLEGNTGNGGPPLEILHPPLKFAICLSGFKLKHRCYEGFYRPSIKTPVFHTIGSLDSTIAPAQTRSLARKCIKSYYYEFFGGHDVPQAKEFRELNVVLSRFLAEIFGIYSEGYNLWEDV